MDAVILSAGFGERLMPHTEHRPKALLNVGGKPVIDYLLAFISGADAVETIHIRTNERYYHAFKDWLRECDYRGKVELSSNGVNEPGGKLGAVGDIEDVCMKKQFKGDIIVAAGDSIFDFPIDSFIDFCGGKNGDVVAVTESADRKALKQGGVVIATSDDRIIDFQEKPARPKSKMLALPLYRITAETIPFLRRYLMDGNERDCIGSFFEWSYRRRPLFAYRTDGTRYHIVDAHSYRKACSAFEKNTGA
ncbi:MAG TPA: sugar phosphate nucleotidyltransferase [Patescibacteria group bacterium]|nr:sugar phosphate nucleotidyltransferase [Patescibacteria group bacterium]